MEPFDDPHPILYPFNPVYPIWMYSTLQQYNINVKLLRQWLDELNKPKLELKLRAKARDYLALQSKKSSCEI